LKSSLGFSLVELVAVLVIASVVFVIAIAKLPENNLSILRSKNDVIMTIRYARQLALIRAQTDTTFSVIISSSSIDLREDNNSLVLPGIRFPLTFPTDLTITQGQGTLYFDRLGNTDETLIQFTDGSYTERVEVTGAGYAY
jgi:prepilin-type N-terminal cleavage/methylation domain-containing protein